MLLDFWGRVEGFLVFIGVYLIGLIIPTACNRGTYTIWDVGLTFYLAGESVLKFILLVFITDITDERHRALAFAFVQIPFICTVFIGPLFGTYMSNTSWLSTYWGVAITTLVLLCSLAGIFQYYLQVAEVGKVYKKPAPSGRSSVQSINYYIREFDLLGSITLKAAFVLLLLPFTMMDSSNKNYISPIFVIPLVVGVFLLCLYGFWQRYRTQKEQLEIRALKRPEIIGCIVLSFAQYMSWSFWNLFMIDGLVVHQNTTHRKAVFVTHVYSISTRVGAVLFGIAVFFTRRFKPICLYLGLPLMILGPELLINVHSTGETSGVGYVTGCCFLYGLASESIEIASQLAVTVYVERESIPIILFLVDMCTNLSGNIGLSVSRKTYKSMFTTALRDALPAGNKTMPESIYRGGTAVQTRFPVGSEILTAINMAWEVYLQRNYIIVTAILVAGFPALIIWKNVYLNQKQNKGMMI